MPKPDPLRNELDGADRALFDVLSEHLTHYQCSGDLHTIYNDFRAGLLARGYQVKPTGEKQTAMKTPITSSARYLFELMRTCPDYCFVMVEGMTGTFWRIDSHVIYLSGDADDAEMKQNLLAIRHRLGDYREPIETEN